MLRIHCDSGECRSERPAIFSHHTKSWVALNVTGFWLIIDLPLTNRKDMQLHACNDPRCRAVVKEMAKHLIEEDKKHGKSTTEDLPETPV